MYVHNMQQLFPPRLKPSREVMCITKTVMESEMVMKFIKAKKLRNKLLQDADLLTNNSQVCIL